MQIITGLLFALALCLAVLLGGQTIDYTWGPALVALAGAMLVAIGRTPPQERWTRGSAWVFGLLCVAWGWVLFRCWGSPVREFARSDALLTGAMFISCLWVLVMPAGGGGIRCLMAAFALISLANAGVGVLQFSDRSVAWPFASRPGGMPSGLFGHYNHLADFSLVSAVMLAARFLWAGDRAVERGLQVLGAVAAIGCVILSGSRGGMIGLVAALAVLVMAWGIIAWRDKRRNRGTVLVGSAVAMVLMLLLVPPLVLKVEQRRNSGNDSVRKTADNTFRLFFMGSAFDLAAEEPLAGGGSRSFGWRKYAAWDPRQDGDYWQFDDDFVHNEILQAAVDYGWTGAGLITLGVLGTGLIGLAGLATRKDGEAFSGKAADAVVAGGLAALAGTLVHSNFSFVTHTLPGAMYLGLSLGMCLPRRSLCDGRDLRLAAGPVGWFGRALMLPAVVLFGYAGLQASMAYRDLWPVWFGPGNLVGTNPGEAMARVERAVRRWPDSEIAGGGADLARSLGEREGLLPDQREALLDRAEDFYAQACALNPLDPEWAINRANVLSILDRPDEAERSYLRAIELQGGMERTFRARYFYGLHLYNRWYQAWTRERRDEEALSQFLVAREVLREAERIMPPVIWKNDGRPALEGLEEVIAFLEGGQVKPRDPAK